MAEKNVDIGGLPVSKENAGQSTPVIENTTPREQLDVGGRYISDELVPQATNFDGDVIVGKDLYVDGKMKIAGEEITGDLLVDGDLTVGKSDDNSDLDVYGNITATGNETVGGNLNVGGTAHIQNIILYQSFTFGASGTLGKPISPTDFYENKHASLEVQSFSAYKIGQFVYLDCKVNGTNYNADDVIFTIKSGYRPKMSQVCTDTVLYNQWGPYSYINEGNLKNSRSTTDTGAYIFVHFFYEVA